jgi:glutaminase
MSNSGDRPTTGGPPDDLGRLLAGIEAKVSPLRSVVEDVHRHHAGCTDGHVADYIPELAEADPAHFGLAITAVDGQSFTAGDTDVAFTIQSVSKPFVYGLALEDNGLDVVLDRVGVEPSGDAFNSIELDPRTNRPFNPMVNAGAIATADLVKGADLVERTKRVNAMLARFAGRTLGIDQSVLLSEQATSHRNRAMALLMQSAGAVSARVEESLDLYTGQCSMLVDARDLSVMAATLANGGVNPLTGEVALEARFVKHVLGVMYTCGMYDHAGAWSVRVGLPAKSGVAGGLLAVVPGRLGIGAYSPLLDAAGNSVRSVLAIEELSERLGLHLLEPHPSDLVTELRRPKRLSDGKPDA